MQIALISLPGYETVLLSQAELQLQSLLLPNVNRLCTYCLTLFDDNQLSAPTRSVALAIIPSERSHATWEIKTQIYFTAVHSTSSGGRWVVAC